MVFAVLYAWSLIALTLCYKTPAITVDTDNTYFIEKEETNYSWFGEDIGSSIGAPKESFKFLIYCFVLKTERVKGDLGQTLKPNFGLFIPV